MRNSYSALVRLSSHPAFSLRDGLLHCRWCSETFGRHGDWERHVLGMHEIWRDEAELFFPSKTFLKWERKRKGGVSL